MIKSLATIATLALLLAACGGGNAGNSGTPSSGQTSTASGNTSMTTMTQQQSATVAVKKDSELSEILVDGSGKTLYLFEADKGGNSSCSSGACAQAWPPLTTKGKPTAGDGASASKLGTITRNDGSNQITYGGHPLYCYAPDSKPGDTKGQGLKQFGAEWYVVSPSGDKVGKGEKGGGGSDESSGGSSGGY